MTFFECYIYVMEKISSSRGVVNDLYGLIQENIITLDRRKVIKGCEKLAWNDIYVKIEDVELMSKIKGLVIFFIVGLGEEKNGTEYMNEKS